MNIFEYAKNPVDSDKCNKTKDKSNYRKGFLHNKLEAETMILRYDISIFHTNYMGSDRRE